ncbi:MAG: type II secretion system protein, partial [Candidatus Gracilibacteria bacterium]|nr:type II secretion system protein [Candidatus Gracilibacteria bacterium]
MQLQKIKAFTLVELIVVIVILSILSTIGFMSFQGYTSDARDSNRITSLKTIQSSLNIYKTKNQTLPLPDNYVDITGVSYQGNIGTGIINKLKLSGTFKDPKDSNYYTYSASKNLSKFQISSLLENNNKIIFSFNDYSNNN